MKLTKHALCGALAPVAWAALLALAPPAAAEEASAPTAAPAPAEQVFATVNGKPITAQEFKARYNAVIRQRYYHGAPPERQAEAVRQEIADLLIERILLVEEAERRGFQPDMARVEQTAAAADKRYAEEPGWEQRRGELLPKLKEQIAKQSLYEQIEKAVRDVPPPAVAEVRSFYDQKPELFTEPEKLYMSTIVLSVDPSSPKEAWAKAREEMQKIIQRIKDGADFAEMARQYSQDKSAANGGNMGYVHSGMLAEHLQAKMDKFQIGDMTDPTSVLEGVAIYRLDDRVPSKLMEFAEVEQRARDLLQRERVEQAWKDTIARLRAAAKIEILLPLGGGAPATQTDSANQGDGGKPEAEAAPGAAVAQDAGAAPGAAATPDAGAAAQSEAAKPDAGAAQKPAAKKKTGGKKKAGKKPS
jgi:hypothetical protein